MDISFTVTWFNVGMGWLAWYLGMENVFTEYCDIILHTPYFFSMLIVERKLKILETTPKSEKNAHFYWRLSL